MSDRFATPPDSIPHDAPRRTAGARPPLILLADDYEDTRDLFDQYLRFRGFEVLLAVDGQEALDLARARRPDLILLDVRMPRMTGTDAMRVLKADGRFAGVPIFALTAHALDNEQQALLSAGFDAVITKPCLPDALAERIEAALAPTNGRGHAAEVR